MLPPTVPSEYVVLDLETTGFKPEEGHEILEIGAQRIVGSDVAELFHALVLPAGQLDPGAERVHGITADLLAAEGRPLAEVLPEFRAFLGQAVLIGHNLAFDVGFLNHALRRLGQASLTARTLDTLDLARRYLILPSYSLESVARFLGVPQPKAHRAMADVETTRRVFLKLVERALHAGR